MTEKGYSYRSTSCWRQHALLLEGTAKRERERGRSRLVLAMGMFALCFLALALRLMVLAVAALPENAIGYGAQQALAAARPDILDRNGEILATDIKTPSLYAEPRKLINVDETVDGLLSVLPDLDEARLRRDLATDRAFVFVKREMSPAQRASVHALGIPGLGFVEESRRIYPAGNAASHVLGHVNIDHEGGAGIEKYLDNQGLKALREAGLSAMAAQTPVALSIDLRVQHALRAELVSAMERYSAKAAAGIILDVHTGEVAAMASLPDFDPNNPAEALEKDRLNRITGGVYELGSTVKAFTAAMALDEGSARLTDSYDATRPIRIGSFTVSDYRGQGRWLTVPEVFMYSSNIGAARMALEVGGTRQRAFLERLGLLDAPPTELPEAATPLVPARWSEATTITAAFGHGISVTPLTAASAAAALVNGGFLLPATFLPRSRAEARELARPVLRADTSRDMRYLMRLNVTKGTATKAEAKGYQVGGKTGTAEKAINGRYAKDRLLTSFLAAFPMDNPRYVVLVMLDEPKGTAETHGYATAGWNAAPVTGQIVRRVAPMLGVLPRSGEEGTGQTGVTLASY